MSEKISLDSSVSILLFMIMLFAFRMNAEADEEHFSNGSYR